MAQSSVSDVEIMAVGGWRTTSEVRRYTEAVEQEALADGAMARIEGRYSTGKDTKLSNRSIPNLSNPDKNG